MIKVTPREWAIANRQWGRALNLAHARYQLTLLLTAAQTKFWKAVEGLYE